MNKIILNNIIRFIGLLLLQVLILNNVNLFGYINPMPYVIWFVLFPIRKNKNLFLITSFLLGLSIDFFSNSGGIHAAAAVFIAFVRLPILTSILNKSDFDYLLFNIRSIPFLKSFSFIAIITGLHHLIVFSLEYFSFGAIIPILKNTFFTGLLTLFISILGIVLFKKKK